MKSFQSVLESFSVKEVLAQIQNSTATQVEQAIQKASAHQALHPDDFLALLSPQASPFLEQMAQVSHQLTQQRFGKTIQMFVPLYLSNECLCNCTYCGFSFKNTINRLTLNNEQLKQEAQYLHEQGFRHILLLSGEDKRYVNAQTLKESVPQILPWFSSVSVEIQPMSQKDYEVLVESGVDGVVVYQETYDRDTYKRVHLAGKKKNYDYRLQTPERAGAAGMRRLGIGALLGLSDWKYDTFITGLHAAFLENQYWRSYVTLSLPRIKEATGLTKDVHPVSDKAYVQALLALRLFLPNTGLVLSTRESASFRNHLLPLGITQMSAGSKTQTGGYFEDNDSDPQFDISDPRSAKEVADMIMSQGYEPVWKDWDAELAGDRIL